MHFLGHVSNEELTALYDVADLFLCASEHEGFCVPIIEAFYKRVPVARYAATAVPATMDGGGVLYETKDPLDVARLMDAVLDDADSKKRSLAVAGRRARGCSPGTSAGPSRGSSTDAGPPPRRAPEVPGISGRSSTSSSASRSCGSSGPALYRALPPPGSGPGPDRIRDARRFDDPKRSGAPDPGSRTRP